MTTTPYYLILLCFFVFASVSGQHYPGGVKGAEVWYKAEHIDLGNGIFQDFSSNQVPIEICPNNDGYSNELFNFNPSVSSGNLCLSYKAPLEHSTNKSIFIVTDPKDNQDSYPHIGTKFNDFVQYPDLDSLSRNTFVIETKQGFASRMVSAFSQHQNAHVHFYSWDNYDIDKKFKSYGQIGETEFFIGKKILRDDLDPGNGFSGLFPEYVTFDRKLTKNERNRVESYLALKYGITKWHTDHYQNSKNKIFWDKKNNQLFGNNIFGIGRDDISGLVQLQCESAHARDYLVAATYEIMATNEDVQGSYMVDDNNFLVFGDNGEGGVNEEPDEKNLRRLRQVWLSQSVGDMIREVPISFRLNLTHAFDEDPNLVEYVLNEQLVVWMLHDQFVKYDFVSDFDNGNVKYYKPFDIDYGPSGDLYALFGEDDIFFDRDNGFFDQFTFAIGPECLLQFRPRYDCEEVGEGQIECYELDIILEGECRDKPVFYLENEEPMELWFNAEQTEINGKPTYTAEICAPGIYTAIVETEHGIFEFEYEAEVIEQFLVDLGPTVQYLSGQQPEVLLDAGQYLSNPQAALYQWFYEGKQIPYVDSTLMVDQPGEYCVEVTTIDQVCTFRRCVAIMTKLTAEVNCMAGYCDLTENIIYITNLDGAPPYTTVVTDNTGQVVKHKVHGGNTEIDGLPGGDYTITITDDLGAEYQISCDFASGFQGDENFNVQNPVLSLTNQQILLDTSTFLIGSSNPTYEWFHNNSPMAPTSPQLVVEAPGEYRVEIYLPEFGCNVIATHVITSILEGTITQTYDCEQIDNTLLIKIDYGFGDYTTVIDGVEYPSGNPYYDVISHSGNIPIINIPYGSHTVTVTDIYGSELSVINVEFVGLHLNIEEQLTDFCNQCGSCYIAEDWCSSGDTLIAPWAVCGAFSLDASVFINSGQSVNYQWVINSINLNHTNPVLFFQPNSYCSEFWDDHAANCDSMKVTVTIWENDTRCSVSETIFIPIDWCPILDYQRPAPSNGDSRYLTSVYPNPSNSDATFYYNISNSSQIAFNGRVEVFSMLGQLIFSNNIQGGAEYTLPYRLVASGAYIIRTTMDDGTVTVDRIIIK